jgi:histidine triad (HIT) family protein
MQDSDCIFCRIAQGQIPALRVWESDAALAFLDVAPLAHGHLLLIPKQHYHDVRDVPAEVLAALTSQLPALAGAVMRATDATGLNLLQNTGRSSGQAVFHLHFHLIPRNEADGLGYRWNAGTYGEGQAQDLQSRILDELRP